MDFFELGWDSSYKYVLSNVTSVLLWDSSTDGLTGDGPFSVLLRKVVEF